MKRISKVLALVLSCLMIIASIPAVTFAYDDLNVTSDRTLTGANYYQNVTISNGAKLTVANGGALYIAGTLTNGSEADQNTALVNNGIITIASGAKLVNFGKFTNTGDLQEGGKVINMIKLPEAKTVTYTSADDTYDLKTHVVNFSYYYVLGNNTINGDGDKVSYTDPSVYRDGSGNWIAVDRGVSFYVLINAKEGDKDSAFADTSRMAISTGSLITYAHDKVNSKRGVFKFDLSQGVVCTVPAEYYRYKNLVRIFTINLPKTEGYYVEDINGNVETCTVEYGKNLEFHVVLSPDYDKSPNVTVYWADLALEPDAKGWYEITGPIVKKADGTVVGEKDLADLIRTGFVSSDNYAMATTGGVTQSADITVMGVISNKASGTMTSVLQMIKQVFEVIREMFAEIFGVFKGEVKIGDLFKNL